MRLPSTGIDRLFKDRECLKILKDKKVGLISNQASLTNQFVPSAYALHYLKDIHLTCLFALEHGWSAFNLEGKEIEDSKESVTNLPIYSLYGPCKEKNLKALKALDAVIIDIQDVGVRCYTYVAVCAQVMEYAARYHEELIFIICDRPNPLGSHTKGSALKISNPTIVSYLNVPFQHGKTIGVLLKDHNDNLEKPLAVTVLPCSPIFESSQHLWIPVSPGLPNWEAVLLYPGLVLLEGVNVSEGRGTTMPFRSIASPNLDFMKIVKTLNNIPESGVQASPLSFTPLRGKREGQLCHGAQIHITNVKKVKGFEIGIYLLHALHQYDSDFHWISSNNVYWIDQLTGGSYLREAISQGLNPDNILAYLN